MRALLYILFITVGGMLSVAIGYLVEPQVSMTVSLIVFMVLLFANFVVSWIAVVLVMDGLLDDAHGRRAQLDIADAGQEAMTAKADYAVGTSIPAAETMVGNGYR